MTIVPAYTVERVASKPRFLKVTCTRTHCGNSFWVHAGKWHSPITPREHEYGLTTRPCPFCFMASWVNGVPDNEMTALAHGSPHRRKK